ncbi:MAG: glycoside hydrolase family 30 protein, partial [Bacteroidales bacterium]
MVRPIVGAFALFTLSFFGCQPRFSVEWITTTASVPWVKHEMTILDTPEQADIQVFPGRELQTIEGFGSCFNELGWTSLNVLSEDDRENIMRELFSPGVGANFTICRMPVAANDFALNWYSYDE